MSLRQNEPEITVLMSVYNGANTLGPVMESILNQTYGDYEFLIINDGSKDDTENILREYASQDQRIRIIDQENVGLTKSLNKGIKLARGQYIARQDADDCSKPRRLEIQLKLFKKIPKVNLIGSNSEDHYDDLGEIHEWGYFAPETLKKVVFQRTPFPHSSVMMRTGVVRELGGYNESYQTTQDAELWMRFAKNGAILMCADKLIERHIHKNSISSTKQFQQWKDGFDARRRLAPNKWKTAYLVLARQVLYYIFPESILLKLKAFKGKLQDN